MLWQTIAALAELLVHLPFIVFLFIFLSVVHFCADALPSIFFPTQHAQELCGGVLSNGMPLKLPRKA
jgi:hypothetical protein